MFATRACGRCRSAPADARTAAGRHVGRTARPRHEHRRAGGLRRARGRTQVLGVGDPVEDTTTASSANVPPGELALGERRCRRLLGAFAQPRDDPLMISRERVEDRARALGHRHVGCPGRVEERAESLGGLGRGDDQHLPRGPGTDRLRDRSSSGDDVGSPAPLGGGVVGPRARSRQHGDRQATDPVPREPETLGPRGLHRYRPGIDPERSGEGRPHLIAARRDRADARRSPSRRTTPPSNPASRTSADAPTEQLRTRDPGHGRIGLREVLPDVAERGRSEQRVGERHDRRHRRRSDRPGRRRPRSARRRATSGGPPRARWTSNPSPTRGTLRHRAPPIRASARARSSIVVIFTFIGSPGIGTHEAARGLERLRVVRDLEPGGGGPIVRSAQRRQPERLRGLRERELVARRPWSTTMPVEHALDRVGDREDRDRPVGARRHRLEHRREQVGRCERPGRVVHDDELDRRPPSAAQRRADRGLPRVAAGHDRAWDPAGPPTHERASSS